jgi:hypothetical protein
MWDGVGMSRGISDTSATIAAGFDLIDIQSGMASMEAALRFGELRVLIGVNETTPSMRAHIDAAPSTLSELSVCHTAQTSIEVPQTPVDRFGRRLGFSIRVVKGSPRDRRALLELLDTGANSSTADPYSERERLVAAIFSEILGTRRIGLHDHFLEVGGNSLSATQVISRLRSADASYAKALTVRDLFEHPTVAEFAAHLDTLRADGAEVATIANLVQPVELDISGLSDEQVSQMLSELMSEKEGAA